MMRHSIPLIPQELLGYHLGLVVPRRHRDFFWNPKVSEKRPMSGWGTRVSKYSVDKVFGKLKIPLRMKFELIDQFRTFDSFETRLNELIKKDKDVLICFDWGTFADKKDYHSGHVSLVDRIEGEQLRMIDTEYLSPKWRTGTLKKIYQSMKTHGSKSYGGLWILEKIK